jgi:Lar family restriction alleviation protein
MKARCPFCGSTNNNWSDIDRQIAISCRKCGAQGPSVKIENERESLKDAIEDARDKWNMRKE